MLIDRTLSMLHVLTTTVPDTNFENVVEDPVSGSEWVPAAAVFVVGIMMAIGVNRFVRTVLGRKLGMGFAVLLTARLLSYLIFVVGLAYSLNTLGVRIGPLLGALGLGGLVLALALQKVVESFLGAMILQTRRPFSVGDTVELDDHVGVVTDIDARTVVLRSLNGEMIRIPNSNVLAGTIINKTREALRRSELTVGVAYDTNLERARDELAAAVKRVQRICGSPPPLVVLRRFGASSIEFSIFYWHRSDVPAELAATHDLILAVHQGLAAAKITIAFPQMVVWSGHDAVEDPYCGATGKVYVEHPVDLRHDMGEGMEEYSWFSRWRSR